MAYVTAYEYYDPFEGDGPLVDLDIHYGYPDGDATVLYAELPEHYVFTSWGAGDSSFVCDDGKARPNSPFEKSDNVYDRARRDGNLLVLRNIWTREEIRCPIFATREVDVMSDLAETYEEWKNNGEV